MIRKDFSLTEPVTVILYGLSVGAINQSKARTIPCVNQYE